MSSDIIDEESTTTTTTREGSRRASYRRSRTTSSQSSDTEDKFKKERRLRKKSSTSSIGSSPYLSFFSEVPEVPSNTHEGGEVIDFEEPREAHEEPTIATLETPHLFFRRGRLSPHRLSPNLGGSQIFEHYQQDISERTQRGSEDGSSPTSTSPTRTSPRESLSGQPRRRRSDSGGRLPPSFERNIALRRSWNVMSKSKSSLPREEPQETHLRGSKGLRGSLQRLGRKLAIGKSSPE